MNKKYIFATLLLLVVLTSSATDTIRQRGCRVGTPNLRLAPRRAQVLADRENPYVGDRRQLVVLVSFQDQDFNEGGDHDAALSTWNQIFNTEGYGEGGYVGSVRDYFLAQSYGQFRLTFDLVFVELPSERWKYHSTDDDENSQYMVDDIVDVLQTQDIDWSLYDWDGDRFMDQMLIIYAGKGQNAGGGSTTVWPHQWWLSQHQNLTTDDETDFRSFRTVTGTDGDYFIDCYCCVQEVVSTSDIKSSFGTICHEYSHCFGFPDFYNDYDKYVGQWDLMDYGNYNGQGFHPCGYSAHERMLMGWLTPVELTAATTVADMPALVDEPRAYLIRNDGQDNEYYIVENRQKRGWDQHLPGSGIVIFHVDYDKILWESPFGVVNTKQRPRYTIFPANNKPQNSRSGGWAYPYIVTDEQDNATVVNDSLTNTSSPAATLNNANADGQLLMSKPITRMAVDADGLASFAFMGGETTGIADIDDLRIFDLRFNTGLVYDMQGRKIVHQESANRQLPKGLYICNGRKIVVK